MDGKGWWRELDELGSSRYVWIKVHSLRPPLGGSFSGASGVVKDNDEDV